MSAPRRLDEAARVTSPRALAASWAVTLTGRALHRLDCELIRDYSGAGRRGVERLDLAAAARWLTAAGRHVCARCAPALDQPGPAR